MKKILTIVLVISLLVLGFTFVSSADYAQIYDPNYYEAVTQVWKPYVPIQIFGIGTSEYFESNSVGEVIYPFDVSEIPNNPVMATPEMSLNTTISLDPLTPAGYVEYHKWVDSTGADSSRYYPFNIRMDNVLGAGASFIYKAGDFYVSGDQRKFDEDSPIFGQLILNYNGDLNQNINHNFEAYITYQTLKNEIVDGKRVYNIETRTETVTVNPTPSYDNDYLYVDIGTIVSEIHGFGSDTLAIKINELYFEVVEPNEIYSVEYQGASDISYADNPTVQSYDFTNIMKDIQNNQYLPDLDDVGNMLGGAIDGFVNAEILPNVTIGKVFVALLGLFLFVIFLKVFAGG